MTIVEAMNLLVAICGGLSVSVVALSAIHLLRQRTDRELPTARSAEEALGMISAGHDEFLLKTDNGETAVVKVVERDGGDK